MKILIATPLYPPDVGGPSYYAKHLTEALREMGHEVVLASFSRWKKLPSGIRHLAFVVELITKLPGVSFVVSLDAFSAGIPAVIASRMIRKPVFVRVSGDFLWERYIERTGEALAFTGFYSIRDRWSQGDRCAFRILRWALRHASGLIFQNKWQQSVFEREYGLHDIPAEIIRNSSKAVTMQPHGEGRNFIWAGRDIKLKNIGRLREAFALAKKENPAITLDIYTSLPQQELFEKLRQCYAVIVPSISEMNPNLVLEGLSFGKPFIVSKETGINEVVGDLGMFVDPFDVQAIADAMISLSQETTYNAYLERIASYKGEHTYEDIAREILVFFTALHRPIV